MSDQELNEENERLKREMRELQGKHQREAAEREELLAKERSSGQSHDESTRQKQNELDSMKNQLVKLTRQLDEEVSKRDLALQDGQALERKLQEFGDGVSQAAPNSRSGRGIAFERESGKDDDAQTRHQTSTKLMNVVGHWMRAKDLQQALLRGACINDMAFTTLVQVLYDCPSLQTLDLSQNQLTMDSCHHICQLITTAPSLSFVSLEGNLFSLRSIGYLMTAVMERQNTKKLTPLDLLDLQFNEGLVSACTAPAPDNLVKQVTSALGTTKLPPKGVELVVQVMRSLWRFLHDTGHPQVKGTSPDEVAFHVMDKATIRKMETALTKLLLLRSEDESADGATQSVTADLVFLSLLEGPPVFGSTARSEERSPAGARSGGVSLPPITPQRSNGDFQKQKNSRDMPSKQSRLEARDPFADLKTAFEPPKDKLKTFNLKAIVTKNQTVLMNMLERLLENTEIDARDGETDQTLLEYACRRGNLSLAKLCYRRGSNLSQRTMDGETMFNIATQSKRHDIMEFLHMYGVKVNFASSTGKTALHVAAANDDVDAVCRLIEWGADVNMRDKRRRTPLHTSATQGHWKVTMLLLEMGADLNAKDDREYTAVACAEAHDHFELMDRLVKLGGRGHGLAAGKKELAVSKSMGDLGKLSVSSQLMKSSSLGRIGKVTVPGLPKRRNKIDGGALDMGMMPLIGLTR